MRKTTIDLKSLFQVFKKNWALIIAMTIIVMLLAVIYAKVFITPLYTSSIEIMVDNRASSSNKPTSGEVTSSQNLISTYMAIIENNVVLEKVQENLDGKYSLNQLRKMLNLSQVSDAMIIRITADTPLPEDSKAVCDATARYAEEVIEATMEVDTIKIIGTANTPVTASSPNIVMYGFVGAVLGFVACYAVLFILAIKDNTIKDKHTVKEYFNLPIFGEIPSFNDVSRGYRKYGNKYADRYYYSQQ